jgi:hypothetical protein
LAYQSWPSRDGSRQHPVIRRHPGFESNVEPSASPGPAKCRGADFAVSTDPWGGAAGSRGTIVVLRVVDSVTACRIGGALDGQITDPAGSVLVEARSDPTLASTVTAGTQLEIGVAWSNWCGPEPTRPLELSIVLPGDAAPFPLVPPPGTEILVPPCLGEGQPSSLSITSLQPLTTPPPEG